MAPLEWPPDEEAGSLNLKMPAGAEDWPLLPPCRELKELNFPLDPNFDLVTGAPVTLENLKDPLSKLGPGL